MQGTRCYTLTGQSDCNIKALNNLTPVQKTGVRNTRLVDGMWTAIQLIGGIIRVTVDLDYLKACL